MQSNSESLALLKTKNQEIKSAHEIFSYVSLNDCPRRNIDVGILVLRTFAQTLVLLLILNKVRLGFC